MVLAGGEVAPRVGPYLDKDGIQVEAPCGLQLPCLTLLRLERI